jgi:hypothetical protein
VFNRKARINLRSGQFLLMKFTDREKGSEALDAENLARFEQLVLPHLNAAFNLAVLILSSRTNAEDVAQDAMLRAFRFFQGFYGGERACVVAADRPQHLLHVVGEESLNEDGRPIR